MSIQEVDFIKRDQVEFSPLGEMFNESRYHTPYDVPVDLINTAHQMRPKEDYGDIKELTRSIKELGVEQPIRVARWSYEKAKQFIEINNRAYPEREPLDPQSLVACPDDESYLVVIYGHRRLAAARQAGHVDIPVKITDDPSFHEVLNIQTAENLHQRPKPFAFARGLKQVYELGLQLGAYKNKAEFARHSAISVAETTSALRYCSLPIKYQEMVVNGELSYSKAVQAARLMESVVDYELLQMRIHRETEVDEMIEKGQISSEHRDAHIGLFEIDGEYLAKRIEGVLSSAVDFMSSPKTSADRCRKYITGRINREFRGVGDLTSILDDDARRKHVLETHRKEAATRRQRALGSLASLVVAVRLDTEAPEEIRREVQAAPTQRMLNKISTATGLLAQTTPILETELAAYDAKATIDELIEAERALLDDEDGNWQAEEAIKIERYTRVEADKDSDPRNSGSESISLF